MGRGADVRPGVRGVRAAGRAGGELRGLHAARDDRGGAARARATGRARPESRSRSRRWRSRPARRRCSRCCTWCGRRVDAAASSQAAIGFAIPIAIVALLVGPGELLFWAVMGNGSYFGIGSASLYVLGLFAVMTLAFIGANLPIVWSLPQGVERSQASRDAPRHGPLALARVRRAVGGGRVPVLRSLLPAAAPAAVPAERGRARAPAAVGAAGDDRARRRHRARPSRCSATGSSRSATCPKYQAVSNYVDSHTSTTDKIFVWGHMPEIYWASDRLPASRFLSSGFTDR